MALFYVCYEDLAREAAWTVHIRDVVNNWGKLGVTTTLFAPNVYPFGVAPKAAVVYVPTIDVRYLREYIYLLILPFFILTYGLRLRPEAIYCREMSLMAPIVCAARLLRAPVIMEINGFLPGDLAMIGASRVRLAVFRLLERINLRLAEHLVFVSEDLVGLFREEYGLDEGKVSVVPNGVDTNRFSPGDRAEGIARVGLDPTRRYITFVGTFQPHSLTPIIVRAAKVVVTQYPNVDFIMIGEGHDLGLCRQTADDLGISDRIVFTGTVGHRAVTHYLRASSVLIDLYRGPEEGRSMKLLEYLSTGGAVVCNYDISYGVALTHRENIFYIPKASPDLLAEAVEILIGDEKLREKIGRGARVLILENFSWKKTAKRLLSVIDEVRARG